jgi:hypothetical protein
MQHNSGSNEANGSKPSLMSKPSFNTKPGGDAQEPSILSSVKGAPAAATSGASKSSKFKIFTLGVLAVAAAYFGYQYMLASQQPGKPNLKANVIIDEKADEAFKSPSAVAKLPSTAMDTSATVATAAPEAAAQIINEPAPAKPAAANAVTGASPESKITTALEDGVKPPPAALEKALASSVPAKTPGQPAVASKAPPAKVVADAGSGKPAAASPSNNPPGNKPASTATAPSADKDVNLIAALLSHGTGSTPKAKTAAAPNTSSTSTQAAAPAAATAATAEPANASLDATTLALKQCGELGFLEREVCRVKTCNNQWETNAACKATMSTASAKP